MTPAPPAPHISVDVVTVAASPLMRAAASLLLLLGRLRASLARAGAGQLMDQVAQAIQQFEVDARAAGAPGDQIEAAKYALAATADDIVQNLPSEDSRVWTQYSMLVRFFNERMGGVRFFQELDRAKQNPAVNLGLLEVMHACLSLGFEGVYRATGGPGELQTIRRDLYETIRRAQPKTIEDLSPHWRGQTIALAGSRFQVPVWSVAAAAGVILLGDLSRAAQPAVRPGRGAGAHDGPGPSRHGADDRPRNRGQAAAGSAGEDLDAARTDPRRAGAKEILADKLDADQSATTIFIRIGSLVLFPSGGAQGQR